jgi:hypothetical protein
VKRQVSLARMQFKTLAQAILFASTVSLGACSTGTEPDATLALSTPPNFSATVLNVRFEGGNGPGGPYSQYDVWVAIPPASTANAGVVVATSDPVFARGREGRLTAAHASDIEVGSTIEVWHLRGPGYGAVQGPPGGPTFGGDQIVIVR